MQYKVRFQNGTEICFCHPSEIRAKAYEDNLAKVQIWHRCADTDAWDEMPMQGVQAFLMGESW